jgi:glycine cleavage system H protein
MSYPADRKYTREHEWVRLAGDTAEVGITDYAQRQLGDVVYIELPDAGAGVEAGQPFGTIESVKAVSELFAPMSGDVIEVNGHVKDHPEVVNTDPHGTWLIRIRVANPAATDTLLDSDQYQELLG